MMDRFDMDRRSLSRSANSSVSGRSGRSAHSSRSWNSLPPEEQELAGSLQTRQVELEHSNHSTSSSGSEARDKLRQAEAAERSLEYRQRQRKSRQGSSQGASGSVESSGAGNLSVSVPGERSSLSPRAQVRIGDYIMALSGPTADTAAGQAHDKSNPPGQTFGQKSDPPKSRSDKKEKGASHGSRGSGRRKTIGDAENNSDAASSRSSHSESDLPDSSQSGEKDKAEADALAEKVKTLEQALRDRDLQTIQMMDNCADVDKINQALMEKYREELSASNKAREAAEDERNNQEVLAAGAKARFDSAMNREKEENAKYLSMHRSNELKASEVQSELASARQDAAQQKKRENIESEHHARLKKVADSRIEHLELMLKKASNELTDARRGHQMHTASERETVLQEQLDEMVEERTVTSKEMSNVRLELMGLKTTNARQALALQEQPAPAGFQQRGPKPRGRKGKGKGRSPAKGFLEMIDEEEDGCEDLPSVDDEGWASECVSSDCGEGGDLDDFSHPDVTAQNDLLNKLTAELTVERKSQQNLRDDHASQNAEQREQIAQLKKEVQSTLAQQETTAEENSRLREQGTHDRIKQLRQVDDLHLKMRDLEETLRDQFMKMQDQTNREELHESSQSVLQEKLQLQTEALRLTGMRMQDALQQHQTEALRQQQQVTTLKLALAMERKRNRRPGDSGRETTAAEESQDQVPGHLDDNPEETLAQRIKELEEERNLLLSKLEIKDVQYQVQLEDTFRDHAHRLREQQTKFEEQIAEIRARYEELLKHPGRPFEERESMRDNTSSSLLPLAGSGSMSMVDACSSSSPQEATYGGSSCSTPVARSVVSAGVGSAGAGSASSVASSGEHVRVMLWSVLALVPGAAALLCNFEKLEIEKVTSKVATMLGGQDLIGQSFFSLLREKSNRSVLRRMMLVNQSMADSTQSEIPNFIARTVGRFELSAADGKAVDSVISVAHLPSALGNTSGQDERRVIVLLAEQQASSRPRGEYSVASSDVCPSDSVSVGKRRPQFASSEVQRTQLRASFFSSMKSRISSASSVSPSSPRESAAPD